MSQHGACQSSQILNKNFASKILLLLRFDEISVSFFFKTYNIGV